MLHLPTVVGGNLVSRPWAIGVALGTTDHCLLAMVNSPNYGLNSFPNYGSNSLLTMGQIASQLWDHFGVPTPIATSSSLAKRMTSYIFRP